MFGNVGKIPYALTRLSVHRKKIEQFGNIRKKIYAPTNESLIEKKKNNLQDPKRKHITHVARTVINTWAHVQVFISARMTHAPVSFCTQSSKCIQQQFGFVLSFEYDEAPMHMHLCFFRRFGEGIGGVVFFRRRRASWYIITFPTHTNFLSHQHLIPDILSPTPYSPHFLPHCLPQFLPHYRPTKRYPDLSFNPTIWGGIFQKGGVFLYVPVLHFPNFVRASITF